MVSGWQEILKSGLLLRPAVSSMTLQKKAAIHHVLKQTTKTVLNEKSIRPVSFISKANTYYAISILYIVSVMPTLWNRVDLESTTLLSMLRAISLNMAVNPSNFLWALK